MIEDKMSEGFCHQNSNFCANICLIFEITINYILGTVVVDSDFQIDHNFRY